MPNALSSQSAFSFDTTVLDALYEHIAVLDPLGNILFVNKAWKEFAIENGYGSSDHGLGVNYCSVTTDKEVEESILSVLDGTLARYAYEYPCHSPTEKRWFLLYATPIVNAQDQITGAVTSHINISKRKLVELQVEELQAKLLETERNRVLIETACAAAHEINQPLTAILGQAQLLSRRTDLPADIADDIQFIEQSGQRINAIVQKMNEVKTYVSKSYVGKVNIVDFNVSTDSNVE
ncbi:MAG: hypothetical protein HOE48_24885 [Candidatus Latescibacteria bacterium]|jgi:signal transduction histidine kinase|nr:hypothetical protein [Candidatus Latescibacterota bacterium]MBT4141168.1 hypothetical protein [Candidatus Latescibacterota bacterium]MBT5831918.1 hypothetical protein [Candidatus Latescibacterota bacterium]